MKVIPKFQKGKRVRKATPQEIEQNKAKQRFLNEHGISVPVNGSWGSWQQQQYDNLTKQNWFVRATLGSAIADNPAVATASGWTQDNNGNYVQRPTPETNKLADNLAIISTTSPTNPASVLGEKAIQGATWLYKMARPVLPRGTYNFGDLSHLLKHKIGEGAEATVIENTPNQVAKVIYSGYQKAKNQIPYAVKVRYAGQVTDHGQSFPVYLQQKMRTITQEAWPKVISKLDKAMAKRGFRIVNDPLVQYRAYQGPNVVIDDISPDNIGLNWFGQPRLIDFNYQTVPEWLEQGFTLKSGGKLILK